MRKNILNLYFKPISNAMKNLIFLMLIVMLPVLAISQDCGYYNYKKGTVLGYQNLDGKGKVTGTSRMTFLDVYQKGNAYFFKVQSETTDEKSKEQPKPFEYTMKCENGEFFIDMSSMMDPSMTSSFGTDVKITSTDLSYPASLSVGQTLPDASFMISTASENAISMNMTINITNRVVAAQESVTVPAGTFDCYKITYNAETKMLFKINSTAALWMSKNGGMIKTETYDKKGKLLGSTVLNEIKLK